MKKTLILFILSLLFYLITCSFNVQANQTFFKSSINPLQIKLLPGEISIRQTHIFKQNGIFRGIFTLEKNDGSYSLGLGEQTAPNIWEIKKEVLTDQQEISNPRVLFIDNQRIRLFYTKFETYYKLYSLDCNPEFNCYGEPNLALDRSETWEYRGIESGYPFLKNGLFYLFYSAWGDSFQIGLAYSSDGLHWTKCTNSPIIDYGAGEFLFEANNRFYLYYHFPREEGIAVRESSDALSCNMRWGEPQLILLPDKSYDQTHLVSPSIIADNSRLDLYYSGRDTERKWSLDLAYSQPATENILYLIIPGFFASWNKEAILHNRQVSIFDWKLPSFIQEYRGIEQSLINLGLVENKDFIAFPYDWRKSIDETAADLDNFLQTKIWSSDPNKKIRIIGHSLGGLIGRIYLQKYPLRNVDRLITVGTPHQGVVQVYNPLEFGEIERENTFLWLIEKIMVFINQRQGEKEKETIGRVLPVLYDLFPTFDFLRTQDNKIIPNDSMMIVNTTLKRYNNSFADIFPQFTAIYGEKNNRTLAGYFVNISGDEQLDPKPVSPYYEAGDYMVLSNSAKDERDEDYQELPLDHNELIYKKMGIERIFDLLSLDYKDNQITEGSKTEISPALIFMMQSPAEMEVIFNGQSYHEEDGIIFIPGAAHGQYNLKVRGNEKGAYTVSIGGINENNDSWQKVEGVISNDKPQDQTDSYQIDFGDNLSYKIISDEPTETPTPAITTPNPTPTLASNPQISSITPTSYLAPILIVDNTNPVATETSVLVETVTPSKAKINKMGSNDEKILGVSKRVGYDEDNKSKNPSQQNIYLFLIFFTLLSVGGFALLRKKLRRIN